MKIIVFSQLYRSKSVTLEIAYDMKNRFIVMYYLFTLKKQIKKVIRTYIGIYSDLDTDMGMVKGQIRPPLPPIQSHHHHNYGKKGRALPARPTSGRSKPCGRPYFSGVR